MTIKRSITIDAPPEKVFNTLNDFNHWQPWSPWLIMEPGVKVTVADDSKYYEWEGDRVGSGNMQVTAEETNKSVDYDLTFLKPWKSKAKVRFELEAAGDSTEVSWYMDSSLPFFLFWMKKITEAYIGMDYERGLMMLKDYIENGEVYSKLDFKGPASFPETNYVGIKGSCTKQEMPERMGSDFGKIFEFMKDHGDQIIGNGFSIYHKWDMVKNQVEYTVGIQVKAVPENLPSGMIGGKIDAAQTYQLAHTGAYKHLGNAWSTLHNMARAKEFKMNKKAHPFEIYLNRPDEVAEKDLVTEINFVIK